MRCELRFDPAVDVRQAHGLDKLRAVQDDSIRDLLFGLYQVAAANDVQAARRAKQLAFNWLASNPESARKYNPEHWSDR